MKLSKSKLALAKVINENGGWHGSDVWLFSTQSGDGVLKFWASKPKALKGCGCTEWSGGCRLNFALSRVIKNWHQTILSREEYYQAYPKADADGWIEWKGGECPVDVELYVYVNYRDGCELQMAVMAGSQRWDHIGLGGDIVSYRLRNHANMHDTGAGDPNPVAEPGFCESVMRSIPEPEAKPTIEQLAQDYRNKLDFAKRKQQESDDAKVAADAALVELERAGEALGLLIGIAKPDRELELVITDWRDLRVGDKVECINDNIGNKYSGVIGVVQSIDYDDVSTPVCVDIEEVGGIWCHKVKFIRRP